MARAVYLDTQCLFYLLGDPVWRGWTAAGTADLRVAVAQAIAADEIIINGSQFHLEESSRVSEEPRKQFLKFFWDIVRWFVLLPPYDLVLKEAELSRRLQATEPFEEYWMRQQLRGLAKEPSRLDSLGTSVRAFVDKSVAAKKARCETAKEQLKAEFANMTAQEVTDRWWGTADAKIEDWVTDYIANSGEHLKLGADKSTWPTPRVCPVRGRYMPTIWRAL
jgi:hypothetical protein